MPDYQSMYLKLFNKVTDAVRILQIAQQEGEDAYIESKEPVVMALRPEDGTDEKQEKQ